MSSRIARDQHGRLVAEGTCVEFHGLRWLVVDWYSFVGVAPRGRRPTARERAEPQRHAPYRAGRAQQQQEIPEDQLDEQAALEAARREQERTPPDLIGRVAA